MEHILLPLHIIPVSSFSRLCMYIYTYTLLSRINKLNNNNTLFLSLIREMRKPSDQTDQKGNNKGNIVKLRKGLWSPEEDEKLMVYMLSNGQGCWTDIARNAGLQRCGKSCRLRWINYLRPDLKRGSFSLEEEELIIHLHSIIGNRLLSISMYMYLYVFHTPDHIGINWGLTKPKTSDWLSKINKYKISQARLCIKELVIKYFLAPQSFRLLHACLISYIILDS